jgi:hypothetical protein
VRARTVLRWDAGAGYTIDFRYPEIADPHFAAFNDLVARRARNLADTYADYLRGSDAVEHGLPPSEALLDFELPVYSDRFVTLDFAGYAYRSGAAHGQPWTESVLFDVKRARAVTATDLFRDRDWVEAISALAEGVLRESLGTGFLGTEAGIREIVARLENWSFRPGEAVITFPVYVVAAYAEGPQTVTIGYDRLAQFLKRGAPLPR